MSKINKKMAIFTCTIASLLTLTTTSLLIANAANAIDGNDQSYNLPSFYNTTNYFHSNKHTSVEKNDIVESKYQIEKSDELIHTTAEGGKYYVDKSDLSMKYQDPDGFIHSTKVNQKEPDYGQLGDTNYKKARSAINIAYYDEKTLVQKTAEESMLTDKSKSKLVSFNKIDNGFEAAYYFGKSDIQISIKVTFEGNKFHVSIPRDGIIENKNNAYEGKNIFRLASISLYSYFGGVYKDSVDGYVFIPDGSGALMRFKNNDNSSVNDYEGMVYGNDLSVSNNLSGNISMPVFGYVHGVNQHGMVGYITQGAEYSKICAYASSKNLPVNRVFPQFIYRNTYKVPLSSNTDENDINASFALQLQDMCQFDVGVTYEFLKNEDANYIGMAKSYRDYLNLEKLSTNYDQIPLRIDTIGQEVTNGVFFKKKIKMTTFDEYNDILSSLDEKGIDNIVSVYHGYTKDGVSWSNPIYKKVDRSLGKVSSLNNLDNTYFAMDCVTASKNQKGYNTAKDICKKINTLLLANEAAYYLNPSSTSDYITKNINSLSKKGADNFALFGVGELLYSSYSKKGSSRSEAMEIYQNLLEGLDAKIALYNSNAYLLKYIDRNFDFSIYNEQLLTFTDTVPFTSIVLSGSVENYSTYINFFSNVRDELLRMIDYNVYPSFILTDKSSSKLEETDLNYIYTSKYEDLKDAVVTYYNFVNNALKDVTACKILNREILQEGVSKITYDNNKYIIVNYLNEEFNYGTIKIGAKNYYVGEVE